MGRVVRSNYGSGNEEPPTGKGGEVVNESSRQLVVFKLGGDEYGIDVASVREIVRTQTITHLPNSGDGVIGVMNLRSRIIPIVDLRARLELPTAETTDQSRVIIVDSQGSEAGLLVDSVREVLTVPQAAIEIMPKLVSLAGAPHIAGIANLPEELITIIDAHELLAPASSESAEETAA